MQNYFIFILFTLILSSKSFSVPEKDLDQLFINKVIPFVEQNIMMDSFKNSSGHKVVWGIMPPQSGSKGLVLILEGRTESHKKYREVIYDLYKSGYDTAIMDWVGQGASDHISSVNHQYGHIDSFETYKKDISILLEQRKFKMIRGQKPIYVLAHSMGANIASLYAAENPDVFSKMALISPMLDIRTDPFPESVAVFILKVLNFIGRGEHKAPFTGEFSPNEENTVTSSEVRRRLFFAERVAYKDHIVGPPTSGFALEAIKATRDMRSTAEKLKNPIMMFQAGDDSIVKTEGQDFVCSRAALCEKILFEKGKHELLMEKDDIRDEIFERLSKFFK